MPVKQLFKLSLLAVSLCTIAACATNESVRYSDYVVATPNYGNFTQAEVNQLKNIRTIYFDTNSIVIKEQYKRALALQAYLLIHDWIETPQNQNVESLTIEGHADIRGSERRNLHLGERRALAIAKFLQSQGVNAKRLAIVTYGKERPVVSGNKKQSEAASRRAIIRYNDHAVNDYNYGHYSKYYHFDDIARSNAYNDSSL